MVEYEQQVNYSMPRQCGLYPPPPYHYPRARLLFAFFQCPPEIKQQYLPPEFKAQRGSDVILIAEYPDSTIGPYNENVILLSCKYNRKPVMFVFNIYVTTDEALTAGREIWGYPKKLCDIYLSPIQDNKVRGNLTRKGTKFLDVEIDLNDAPSVVDVKSILGTYPVCNLKIIPDVADNSKPALRQLTATDMGCGETHQKFGANTNYIKTEYSQYDICHEILKDANKNLGGFYTETDMILPNGRLLE